VDETYYLISPSYCSCGKAFYLLKEKKKKKYFIGVKRFKKETIQFPFFISF